MKVIDDVFMDWWYGGGSNGFDALCFDIDGTLQRGEKALPGAAALIDGLRREDYPFILLTNDGNHSIEEKCARLADAGLDIRHPEIVSCGLAISFVVSERHLRGRRFFVMGDLGTPNFAELAGLAVSRDIDTIDLCDGVIVGEGNYNWEPTINAVVNFFIRHPKRPILVPNPDTYWPDGHDGICVGAGGKARFMDSVLREFGIPIEIIYLGKPFRVIYDYTLSVLKARHSLPDDVDPRRVLMIGDSLKSDIKGAVGAGFSSALVLTGITNMAQVAQADADASPDLVFKSLG